MLWTKWSVVRLPQQSHSELEHNVLEVLFTLVQPDILSEVQAPAEGEDEQRLLHSGNVEELLHDLSSQRGLIEIVQLLLQDRAQASDFSRTRMTSSARPIMSRSLLSAKMAV